MHQIQGDDIDPIRAYVPWTQKNDCKLFDHEMNRPLFSTCDFLLPINQMLNLKLDLKNRL